VDVAETSGVRSGCSKDRRPLDEKDTEGGVGVGHKKRNRGK